MVVRHEKVSRASVGLKTGSEEAEATVCDQPVTDVRVVVHGGVFTLERKSN